MGRQLKTLKLDIIVPVYNEAENILNLYENICRNLDAPNLAEGFRIDWTAFIVYDFAEDSTRPFAEQLQKKDPRIRPTLQTFGKGALNALKYSFSIVQQPAVICIMGDCCDDLSVVPRMMLEVENGAVIVSASRFIAGGEYTGGHFLKKYLSHLAGAVLRLFGLGTNDPTNNFKMYSAAWLKNQKIESTGGFEVALEFAVKASLNKEKIVEIPGRWKDRTLGTSKFNVKKLLPHYLYWFFFFLRKRILF